MNPAPFPEANAELGAPPGMTDCQPLKIAHVDAHGMHQMVSLWRPTWRERLSILFFGKVWVGVVGYGHPPIWLDARRQLFTPPAEPAPPVV